MLDYFESILLREPATWISFEIFSLEVGVWSTMLYIIPKSSNFFIYPAILLYSFEPVFLETYTAIFYFCLLNWDEPLILILLPWPYVLNDNFLFLTILWMLWLSSITWDSLLLFNFLSVDPAFFNTSLLNGLGSSFKC